MGYIRYGVELQIPYQSRRRYGLSFSYISALVCAKSASRYVADIPTFVHSYIVTNIIPDLAPLISLAHNLTNCGISPHLNHTLLSSTAAQNSTPYLLYSNAGIWSWAPGQPTNDSTSRGSNNNDDNNDLYRCATTSVSTGLWSVSDCSTRLPAACRSVSHPYNWTVTSHDISYGSAAEACGNEYVFAAPMTALENAYLTKRIRESRRDGRVWVDFNALNIEACWVMGGPNAICPYGNGQGYDDLERRTILVCLLHHFFPFAPYWSNDLCLYLFHANHSVILGPHHSRYHRPDNQRIDSFRQDGRKPKE